MGYLYHEKGWHYPQITDSSITLKAESNWYQIWYTGQHYPDLCIKKLKTKISFSYFWFLCPFVLYPSRTTQLNLWSHCLLFSFISYSAYLLTPATPSLRPNVSSLGEKKNSYFKDLIVSLLMINNCCFSVAQSSPPLCNPMDYSMLGFPVLHYLPEFAQTLIHWVGDAIQPSHSLLHPSPTALNLSQHQGLFQLVGFSHKETKVLELQLQHQSFQWIFRVYFL